MLRLAATLVLVSTAAIADTAPPQTGPSSIMEQARQAVREVRQPKADASLLPPSTSAHPTPSDTPDAVSAQPITTTASPNH